MLIRENQELTSTLLAEMMEGISEDRSAQHPSVTDLIDCLTKTYYNSELGSKLEYTDQTKVYFLVGLGLEGALLTRRKENPVAGQKDGIFYHVDSLDGGLIEVKSTRASVNRTEEKFSDRWLRQTKSYAKATGVSFLDVAVIFLIPGEFKVYRVEYDGIELDVHWEWMKHRRDVWLKAKELKRSPEAFRYNEEYECKGCQYKMICDVKAGQGL